MLLYAIAMFSLKTKQNYDMFFVSGSGKPSPDISMYLLRQNDEGIVGELVTYTHMKNQQVS